jgi:hypothetical protein
LCARKSTAAISEFELAYLTGEPTDEALCNIGECYEKLREWEPARRYYRQVRAEPEMDEAWLVRVLFAGARPPVRRPFITRKATQLRRKR